MAWESKPGDISLFQAGTKKNEKQPDWKGTVNIDGVDHEVAMWNKTTKSGDTFLSGKVGDEAKPKHGIGFTPKKTFIPTEKPKQSFSSDLDDDLPF
jgi:uncharacterized protein (DUF736 family)